MAEMNFWDNLSGFGDDVLSFVQNAADFSKTLFNTDNLPQFFDSRGFTTSDDVNRSIMGSYIPEAPKEEPGFFERLTRGVTDGATAAWKKDPLEVLKFGANAVGGYFASDRANKQLQAQIDAYNARIKAEEDARAAQAASIAAITSRYGKKTKPTGPLTRKDGSRVFNADGTVR